VWVEPPRRDRADRTYGEHLEALLHQRGVDCRVTNLARWNQLIPKALCQFELAVRAASPDVLVLHYGAVEAFPAVFPLKVHDYLHTWHVHPGFGRTRLRNVLRRRLWKRLRTWQSLGARLLGPRTHHVGPERFRAELTQLLEHSRRDQANLTLVMGIPRPSAKLCALVPGIESRFERFNAVMQEACERAGDSAVFVDLTELPDGPELVPDGLHLSAEAHLQVGQRLAGIVEQWARESSGVSFRGL
jgi:hypothetical protein